MAKSSPKTSVEWDDHAGLIVTTFALTASRLFIVLAGVGQFLGETLAVLIALLATPSLEAFLKILTPPFISLDRV
jgi:hypothetical protein